MKSSRQYFSESHNFVANTYHIFLEMMDSEAPITVEEVHKLADMRPGVWEKFIPYVENFWAAYKD